jgi:signal transduction histidine kinase
LHAALENLIGNAWKFTGRKEAAAIEVGELERDGKRVFFVRDNGSGFDPQEARDLFKPFRRLASSGSFEGTGVGLATVQRIVRRHGGRLWAEARPGEGATFYFTLGS